MPGRRGAIVSGCCHTVRRVDRVGPHHHRAPSVDFSCGTTGQRKIAAVIFSFPGIPKPDIDPNTLRQMLFGSPGASINTYWRDASHGKASATGDVFAIDMDHQYSCFDRNGLERDVRAAAARKQIDLSKYDHLVMYCNEGCGILGQSGVGCGSASSILVTDVLEPAYYHPAAGNTRVFVNGLPAPIASASAGQVNAVVPYGVSGPSAAIRVEFEGRRSADVNLTVAPAAPGVFTYAGQQRGVMVNQDGSFSADAQPAGRGSVVTLFATGAGHTTPA